MRDFFSITTNQPVGARHLNASEVLLSVRMTRLLDSWKRSRLVWASVVEPLGVGKRDLASRCGNLAKGRSAVIAFTDELGHRIRHSSAGPLYFG